MNFWNALRAFILLLISLAVPISARSLTCPGSEVGTETCDCDFAVDPMCDPLAHYEGGKLCLVAPVESQNINGDSVCILGRIRTFEDVEALTDLVAAATFPDEEQSVPDEVAQPAIDAIEPDGSFRVILPLSREGEFLAIVQAGFYVGGTDPEQAVLRVPVAREFTRIGIPDYTVVAAGDSTTHTPYTTTPITDSDGDGIPNEADNDLDNDGLTNDIDPDDDNDGLCDQTVDVVGAGGEIVCTAGETPDPVAIRHVAITASAEAAGGVSSSHVDLCLKGATETQFAGTDLTFTVTNEVTDTDSPLEKILHNTTVEEVHAADLEDSGFCADGFVVTVPLGHGENRLEVQVDNDATEGTGGQRITVTPIQNDIRGPEFCVTYLTAKGREIPDVDGNVLLVENPENPPQAVTLDVAICGRSPDELPPPPAGLKKASDCDTNRSTLCLQVHNETEASGAARFQRMATADRGGITHYQFVFDALRFPINTFTLKGYDRAGNLSQETHSFGFGQVRPLVDATLRFNPASAQIPQALSLFLPASYLRGELKEILLKVLNSDKFEIEMFPKLLEPHQPATAVESACPEAFPEGQARVIRLGDYSLGTIEIPRLELLSGNRLRLSLEIHDLTGTAEIFSIRFTDTDGDEIPDVDDDDDDCPLDDETCRGDEPDTDDPQGDNDGDGYRNERDYPGQLVVDPIFETEVLPVRLAVEQLNVHLQLRILQEDEGLRFEILNIPGEELVSAIGQDSEIGPRLIQFRCSEDHSLTYFNGYRREILQDECEALEELNRRTSSEGRDESCLNQNLDQETLFTLKEMLYRQIPKQLENELTRLATERLSQLSLEMFEKKLAMDLFANLGAATIEVSPLGLFATIPALIAPAGVTEADSEAPLSAEEFLTNEVDPSLLGATFGPIREPDSVDPVDPADATSRMGGEINLALGEEFVNSLLHSVHLLLSELIQEKPDLLDLSISKLRGQGLGVPDIPNGEDCFDENGVNILDDQRVPGDEDDPLPDNPTNNWKCFNFNLDIATMLGVGRPPELPPETPVVIRTRLNPRAPMTARVVNLTALGTSNSDGTSRPPMISLELELGIRDGEMSLYEGRFLGNEGEFNRPIELVDWCERQPQAHPDCRQPDHVPLPMVTFKSNGRLFVKLTLLLMDDGMITITGGLSERLNSSAQVELDTERSYLNLSVVANNTIVRDTDKTGESGIVTTFQGNIGTLLRDYVANSDRAIWLQVPLTAPLSDFCKIHPEVREFCGKKAKKTRSAVDDLWEDLELADFGINGVQLNDLLIGMTGSAEFSEDPQEALRSMNSAPRHLTLGLGACLKNLKGRCIDD